MSHVRRSPSRASRRAPTPPIRVVLAAVVAACLSALTLAPAHAAAYRYWGFYQLTGGTWAYAQKGPDQTVPKDGAVDGWRFAVARRVVHPLPPRRPHLRPGLRLDPCRGGQEARRSRRRLRAPGGCRRRRDPARAEGPVRRRRHGRHERGRAGHGRRRAHREGTGLRRRRLPDERLRRRRQGGQPRGEGRRPAGDRRRADQPPPPRPRRPRATGTDVAAAQTSGTSGGSVAAYVIAGLVLLALIAYLLVRSRSRARQDG